MDETVGESLAVLKPLGPSQLPSLRPDFYLLLLLFQLYSIFFHIISTTTLRRGLVNEMYIRMNHQDRKVQGFF